MPLIQIATHLNCSDEPIPSRAQRLSCSDFLIASRAFTHTMRNTLNALPWIETLCARESTWPDQWKIAEERLLSFLQALQAFARFLEPSASLPLCTLSRSYSTDARLSFIATHVDKIITRIHSSSHGEHRLELLQRVQTLQEDGKKEIQHIEAWLGSLDVQQAEVPKMVWLETVCREMSLSSPAHAFEEKRETLSAHEQIRIEQFAMVIDDALEGLETVRSFLAGAIYSMPENTFSSLEDSISVVTTCTATVQSLEPLVHVVKVELQHSTEDTGKHL